MIQAIIFDFGDVICFWRQNVFGHDTLAEERARAMGWPPDSIQQVIIDYLHASHEGAYHSLEDYFVRARPATPVSLAVAHDVYQAMESSAYVDQRMIDLIVSLKPQYKIALLSNFSRGLDEWLEDRFRINHLFDVVVSSYDQKVKKPHPDIYLYTVEKLQVSCGACLFIDDKEKNVASARSLGLRGLVFTNFDECRASLSTLLKQSW